MGRKAKFDENIKEKKGPGRKARKQKDPKFPQLQSKPFFFFFLNFK